MVMINIWMWFLNPSDVLRTVLLETCNLLRIHGTDSTLFFMIMSEIAITPHAKLSYLHAAWISQTSGQMTFFQLYMDYLSQVHLCPWHDTKIDLHTVSCECSEWELPWDECADDRSCDGSSFCLCCKIGTMVFHSLFSIMLDIALIFFCLSRHFAMVVKANLIVDLTGHPLQTFSKV